MSIFKNYATSKPASDYTTDQINARRLDCDIVGAGQPSRAQPHSAAREGVRTAVNLRPDVEFGESDEADAVHEMGLRHVHLPTTGADESNIDYARRLDEALTESGATPAPVHCTSANRVGALLAYRSRYLYEYSAEDALRMGIDAGLNVESSLFAALRSRLS